MGLFDSVMVPCPSCGTKEEFQSKSGPCLLDTFELEEAPEDVLLDVNRHSPITCSKCGAKFGVAIRPRFTGFSVLWNSKSSREEILNSMDSIVHRVTAIDITKEESIRLREEYIRLSDLLKQLL